jgi:hypothetical protein
MKTMARLLALLWLSILVVTHAQTPAQGTGTLTGVVTDPDGGLLPGVAVTATSDTTTRSVVSNASGQYVITGVPPGRYRVEAALAGFRTTSRDAVEVVAGQTTQSDFVMRLGIWTRHGLQVAQTPSSLSAQSAFIGHVRIREAVREAEFHNSPSIEWEADVLSVAKGTQYVGGDRRLRFWQTMAGRIYVDGQIYVGESARHSSGEEFVAFFSAESGGVLVERHRYMTPVSGGIAQWAHPELEGVQRGLPVARFLDAIRRLLK